MALNALPEASEKREAVRRMFDRIAARYDRLNRLLTLGLDQRWRSRALADMGTGPGDRLIDLACGTGDLAERAAARGALEQEFEATHAVGVGRQAEVPVGAVRRGEARLLHLLLRAEAVVLDIFF